MDFFDSYELKYHQYIRTICKFRKPHIPWITLSITDLITKFYLRLTAHMPQELISMDSIAF